ncbi:MAG: hypothetical protein O2931_09205 [Planctomycetota bacterium]|nr:hypothetical protein [Planctomycetota bacterium]MDA1178960.1 hypothetical protein [Planctomycetota bacterium]
MKRWCASFVRARAVVGAFSRRQSQRFGTGKSARQLLVYWLLGNCWATYGCQRHAPSPRDALNQEQRRQQEREFLQRELTDG